MTSLLNHSVAGSGKKTSPALRLLPSAIPSANLIECDNTGDGGVDPRKGLDSKYVVADAEMFEAIERADSEVCEGV